MTTMETELILLEQIQNLVDADAKASDNTAAVSADNSPALFDLIGTLESESKRGFRAMENLQNMHLASQQPREAVEEAMHSIREEAAQLEGPLASTISAQRDAYGNVDTDFGSLTDAVAISRLIVAQLSSTVVPADTQENLSNERIDEMHGR